MPRRGRKKILGKRPDIEQEKRAEELQDLARELHREQRFGQRHESPQAHTADDANRPADEQ